jgi:3-oxoacyl-[acyl-carrier protein] reductase
MMLKDKTAVIYGAGGAIGGAAARAFSAAGGRVYLAGRSKDRLEKVASDIADVGGVAEVDALDEHAVGAHVDAVAADAGGIDIALNAVAVPFVHGVPFVDVAVDDVMHPIVAFLQTNLITAQAVGRHMSARGTGTILTLSTAASRFVFPGTLGYGTTGTLVEVVSERLAIELGPSGVRVVCLRPHAIGDGPAHGCSSRGPQPLASVSSSGSQSSPRTRQCSGDSRPSPTSPRPQSFWHRIGPARSPARSST